MKGSSPLALVLLLLGAACGSPDPGEVSFSGRLFSVPPAPPHDAGTDSGTDAGDGGDPYASIRSCPERVYRFLVDDSFELEQRNVIFQAFQDWVDAGEGKIDVPVRTIVPALSVPTLDHCTIRVQRHDHPDPSNLGYTIFWPNDDGTTSSARVWIRTDITDVAELRADVMHELGHALGVGHSDRSDMTSCMWPFIQDGCLLTAATCARLCALWRCDAPDGG